MSIQVEAVYENGVLRPLAPLELAENQHVIITLRGDFLAGASLAELALAQKVKPMEDVSLLSGGFPGDENIDEFLEEIYSARK